MKQTIFSGKRGSLLDHAVSRLSPEIFSHPVWVRFGKKEERESLSLTSDLLSAVKNLQDSDPSTACQVLLICAVYQHSAAQHFNALKSLQSAIALAQQNQLFRNAIWALGGACAFSIQQKNFEQAASNFVDLQVALNEQNEWILASFIDVLRQAVLQHEDSSFETESESPHNGEFTEMLAFILEWFQHWGFWKPVSEAESGQPGQQIYPTRNRPTPLQSFFSIRHWQERWQTLMLAIRSKLRLQPRENDVRSLKNRSSFWDSMPGSSDSDVSTPKSDTQAADEIPLVSNTAIPPTTEQTSVSKTRIKKAASTRSQISKNQRPGQATTVLPVSVYMLGAFRMTIGVLTVKLPASRSLSLLKYLLLHYKQKIPREVLMDTFWPDADAETARNNLNVAMHSLRKALRTVIFLPVIVFENGAYGLAPDLQIWLDTEEFERCVRAGQQFEARNQLTAAVTEYEAAISLYQGDFLEQNPYEEWTVIDRERLRMAYLGTLGQLSQIYFNQAQYAACIAVCQLILTHDRCREDAHCLLMRCYSRQGQHHLALRQYQLCVEVLRAELDVEPAPQTTQLYEQIRREHT